MAFAAGPLKFHLPEGWLDLSPGAPAENFQGLSDEMLMELRKQSFAHIALDMKNAGDGFAENVNVSVLPKSARVTPELLNEIATQALAEIKQQRADAKVELLSKDIVPIHGVHCARLITDTRFGTLQMKQMMYFLPGAENHAVMTFSAAPDKFAEYQPLFEKTAAATEGLAEPPSTFSRYLESALLGALACGLIGALVGPVLYFGRRRKPAPAPTPPPAAPPI